jgi:hypothetical protein
MQDDRLFTKHTESFETSVKLSIVLKSAMRPPTRSASVRDGQPNPEVFNIFNEYGEENFNAELAARAKCFGKFKDAIVGEVSNCTSQLNTINTQIIQILEKDSSLFIELSQCISNFEREFSEFPSKILELRKLVDEAANFPVPSFDEIPPPPQSLQIGILGKPSWLVNAPLKYDCLVQQHRISEAIQLVVDCLAAKEHVPVVDSWVEKTRAVLHKDIQTRLKTLQLNSEDAKKEFRRLQALGFESESIAFFLKLSSRSLQEKISGLPGMTQFLQFVRVSSTLLCTELAEIVQIFTSLWRPKFYAILISWVGKQVESRLPMANPENFAGNFNLVKDSVKIMIDATAPLEELGISTRHLFDNVASQFADLLASSAARHVEDMAEKILEENWQIGLAGLRGAALKDYPVSPSFEDFQTHLIAFAQEMRPLYEPSIFCRCANLLREVLLSYPTLCLKAVNEHPPQNIDGFCAIPIQMQSVVIRLLPKTALEFESITGHPFIEQESTQQESERLIHEVLTVFMRVIVGMWRGQVLQYFPQWKNTKRIEIGFRRAVGDLGKCLTSVALPEGLYTEATEILIEEIVPIIGELGQTVDTATNLNSFDFHWRFLGKSIAEVISPKAKKKLQDGISSVAGKIALDRGINPEQRMKAAALDAAVTAVMNADDTDAEESVEEEEDAPE